MVGHVTIVTLASGSSRNLRATLTALRSAVAGLPFDSLILENGVPGVSWLRSLPFMSTVLHTDRALSPGTLLNSAMAHAKGEFVVFLPAGAIPEKHWLTAACAAFANEEVAAVVPRVLDSSGTQVRACGAGVTEGRLSHHHAGLGRDAMAVLRPTVLDLAPLCGLAVRRTSDTSVGGYDPAFETSLFDYDWSLRARFKGFAIAYRPDATIRYDGPLLLGTTSVERPSAQHFFERWKSLFAPNLEADVFLP